MNGPLTNQKILIVGGTSGVRLAIAKQAQQRGARVIVASRNAKYASIPDAPFGNLIETYSLDITDSDKYGQLFEAIGEIDQLVVTVRAQVHSASFLSIDAEEAKKAFDKKF